tara:strand:- start:557 stop:718 length:162 start_codon:yes stop_codon:yes gene_type:complete
LRAGEFFLPQDLVAEYSHAGSEYEVAYNKTNISQSAQKKEQVKCRDTSLAIWD